MKVQILSSYENKGGAARAANRLHNALIENDIASYMRVKRKSTDSYLVTGPVRPHDKLIADFLSIIEALPARFQKTQNQILHSAAWVSSVKASEINKFNADVVNLHWICDGLISIANIGRINRPLVWTLHDSWTFCGMEHHPNNDQDTRFEEGYNSSNKPSYLGGLDLDRWTWKRKRKHFSGQMHLVAPSNWLAEKASKSAIAGNWPVSVIPNPLDIEVFRPLSRSFARSLLKLPQNKKIILIGAFGSVLNKNKGFDLFQESLKYLNQDESIDKRDLMIVVFGQSKPKNPIDLPLPVHFMGHLNDDYSLSLLYNAANLVIVPSRMENLPQTATEAQSCGIPVVAFDVCGIPDAVEHQGTGYLAQAYNTSDLANGIRWILEDEHRYQALSENARKKAEQYWAPSTVVDQYLNVYNQAIENHKV